MQKVEDVEFVEVEEVNQTLEEYEKLPKSAKASIAKIRGEKSIFDNADVNTYLLGGALGGGYAVYKGKKVLIGVAFGLVIAHLYIEFLENPSK